MSSLRRLSVESSDNIKASDSRFRSRASISMSRDKLLSSGLLEDTLTSLASTLVLPAPPSLKEITEMKPDRKFRVKYGDQTREVECNMRESVDVLRDKISEIFCVNMDKFYLVSEHGVMQPGTAIDIYKLANNSLIVLMKRCVDEQKNKSRRRFWLREREDRLAGRNTMRTSFAAPRIDTKRRTKRAAPTFVF